MSDKALRVPLGLRSWQELNRRTANVSNAYGDHVESEPDPHGHKAYTDAEIDARVAEWRSESPDNDWVPDSDNQWVGDAHKHPLGVAIGKPTADPDDPGIEGVVTERTQSSPTGGVAVVGYRDQQNVKSIPNVGTLANATCEIAGQPVLLAGSVFLEVAEELTDSYYLTLGASYQLLDGRHMAPLMLGPRYIPALQETFSETTDYDLDSPAVVLAGSTLTQTYAANDSHLEFQITLAEESSNRTSTITVEFWGSFTNDGGTFQQYWSTAYPMSSNSRLDVSESGAALPFALAIGDQVELRVSAVKGHQQATPFVRGSLRASTITAKQG